MSKTMSMSMTLFHAMTRTKSKSCYLPPSSSRTYPLWDYVAIYLAVAMVFRKPHTKP